AYRRWITVEGTIEVVERIPDPWSRVTAKHGGNRNGIDITVHRPESILCPVPRAPEAGVSKLFAHVLEGVVRVRRGGTTRLHDSRIEARWVACKANKAVDNTNPVLELNTLRRNFSDTGVE